MFSPPGSTICVDVDLENNRPPPGPGAGSQLEEAL